MREGDAHLAHPERQFPAIPSERLVRLLALGASAVGRIEDLHDLVELGVLRRSRESMILAECPVALPAPLIPRRRDEVLRARRPRSRPRAAFVGLLLRADGKFSGRHHCQCVNVVLVGRRGLTRRVECDAAIDVGLDVVPIDTDGIAQVGDRQIVASRLRVRRSAAEVGLRETVLVGITAVYNFRAAFDGLAGVRARAHGPGETGDRV